MSMRPKLLAIVLALLALTVAACSSSTNNSTPGASSATGGSSPPTAAASGAPITVGVICSCSGPFGGNLTAEEIGYKAWVDAANASGGINGHPIKLITEDDAATPGLGIAGAQKLVADHVNAVVDISLVDQDWASMVQQSNIPVVGSQTSEEPFATNSDFYSQGLTQNAVAAAGVSVAKAAGATNVGVLYCAEAAVCAQNVPLVRAAGKQLGVPMAYSAAVSSTAPNYTAQCLAAKQAHIAALDLAVSFTVMVHVAQNCAQVGYQPIYFTPGESYGPIIAASSPINQNFRAAFPVIPLFATTPAVEQMNAALDKYYPGFRANYQTTDFSELDVYAWASGLLLEDAVKAGGLTQAAAPSPAEIVKGLDALKGDTLDGMAPPLTFTPGQPNPVNCWITGQIVKGVATVANNGKASCTAASS